MCILVDERSHDSGCGHHRSTHTDGHPRIGQHRFERRLEGHNHDTELDELRTYVLEEGSKLLEDGLHESFESKVSGNHLADGLGRCSDALREELRHLLIELLHGAGHLL